MSNSPFAVVPEEGQSAQSVLEQYLNEANTAICLVFGGDKTCLDAVAVARSVGGQGLYADVRVLHVPNVSVLTDEQRRQWRPQVLDVATVLNFDREVSARLPADKATVVAEIQFAFGDALAGKRL